ALGLSTADGRSVCTWRRRSDGADEGRLPDPHGRDRLAGLGTGALASDESRRLVAARRLPVGPGVRPTRDAYTGFSRSLDLDHHAAGGAAALDLVAAGGAARLDELPCPV